MAAGAEQHPGLAPLRGTCWRDRGVRLLRWLSVAPTHHTGPVGVTCQPTEQGGAHVPRACWFQPHLTAGPRDGGRRVAAPWQDGELVLGSVFVQPRLTF